MGEVVKKILIKKEATTTLFVVASLNFLFLINT